MLRTRTTSGKIFTEIKESINVHEQNVRLKVKNLGSSTVKKMKVIIKGNKVRPQAGEPTILENNIDVEFYSDDTGWGVGEIAKLDKNAKHWRAINYGSKHLVGKHLPPGIFEPGTASPDQGSFRAGRFKEGMSKDGSSYSPIIKKEILPMNYITKTINFVRREINKLKFGK